MKEQQTNNPLEEFPLVHVSCRCSQNHCHGLVVDALQNKGGCMCRRDCFDGEALVIWSHTIVVVESTFVKARDFIWKRYIGCDTKKLEGIEITQPMKCM